MYAYNNAGDHRNNESLAALCLEKTPPFHKWYFETRGRSNKQDKKKGRDHAHSLRGIEIEEHRKSNDRGNVTECSNASSESATYVPRRGRSGGSQSIERKWRRQVKIVLAIDIAICLTLLGVWLAICHGIECTRS